MCPDYLLSVIIKKNETTNEKFLLMRFAVAINATADCANRRREDSAAIESGLAQRNR
jgi:hypothetical protein